MKLLIMTATGLAALLLAACGDGKREAASETPVAKAEVETQLPASTVTDQELQQAADQAAAQASTPAPGTTMPATPATMPAQ